MVVASHEIGLGRPERWLSAGLALAGLLGLLCALWMTPEFAVRHHAIQNALDADRLGRLLGLRIGAAALGLVLLVLATRTRWLLSWLPRTSRRSGLPLIALAGVLAAFGALFALNLALQVSGLVRETAALFPVSVVRVPEVHWSGLPWLALFVLLAVAAARRREHLTAPRAWLIGAGLLLLGNLGQGGFAAGFERPFTDPSGGPPPGVQYYHDAVRVGDAAAWLAGFNAAQPELLNHTRTHPPFAVLLHHAVLSPSGGSVAWLALCFVAFASLALPLSAAAARCAGVPPRRAAELSLLLAALPAFNVYAAASLDALVLTTSTLALWGLLLARSGRAFAGSTLFCIGFLATQALSFGGAFLAAVAGLLGAIDFWRERRLAALGSLGLGLAALAVCVAGLQLAFGYDHLEAFLTASRLENPEGFRGLARPLDFAMTRVEGVAEIALFLSLPVLAVLASRRHRGTATLDVDSQTGRVLLAGGLTLAAMFLAGAWWTGETARACLFVTPYLMLALHAVPAASFGPLLIAAALQTALMQGVANFYW